MSYECEDCGETFDTLTEKRTHDCPGESFDETVDGEIPDNATVDELETVRDRIANDEFEALYTGLASFETLQKRLSEENPDAYRDTYWEYYESFADGLDRYTREVGWDALSEFVEAYHPESSSALPHVSAVVENAVGRFLIRTRLESGVEAIPADALAYLRSIPPVAPEGADTAFEEAQTYGWGIGHPEHAVADHLHEMAEEHRFWAKAALEQAFYADQHAAVDVLERLVTDEAIDFTIQHPTETVDAARFFLDSAAGAASDFAPRIPRYWDWQDEYDYTFQWKSGVKENVRHLIRETGVHEDLPAGWTIEDLAI